MSRRKADLRASQEQALAYGQRKADEVFKRHEQSGHVTADFQRAMVRTTELVVLLATAYTIGAQESGGKIQRRNGPGTQAHNALLARKEADGGAV